MDVDAGVIAYDGLVWSEHRVKDGLVATPTNCLLATQDGSVSAGGELGISIYRDGRWRPVRLSRQPTSDRPGTRRGYRASSFRRFGPVWMSRRLRSPTEPLSCGKDEAQHDQRNL